MAGINLISGGLEPFSPGSSSPWDRRRAAHLLRRARMGAPSRADIDLFVSLDPGQAVDRLFEFGRMPDSPSWADEPITLPPDKELERQRRIELIAWWLRTAQSDSTIRERLVYFWSNHFVVEAAKVKNPQMIFKINKLFRTYACGNIKELTKAVGKEPAMLVYLDGQRSKKDDINENYGRELQELFTIGRGNYTQEDVVAAARAYTGWQVDRVTVSGIMNPRRHDYGVKTFYGKSGPWNGDDIVEIIFERVETALFLAEKIYRHFVYHVPDEAVVQGLAELLRKNGYNLEPVLKTLLKSAHFMDESLIGADIKSPMDFLFGIFRQLRSKRENWAAVARLLARLGQPPFNPPNVAGWEEHRSWLSASTLADRQGTASVISSPRGSNWFDFQAFLGGYPEPEDLDNLVEAVLQDLLAVPVSKEVKNQVMEVMLQGRDAADWDTSESWAMEGLKRGLTAIIQMPEYQLH